jgi:ATP-dependent DNA ligase
MFLYPSKPKEIRDPEKLIVTLKDLRKLGNYRVQIKKNGCRAIPVLDEKVTIFDRAHTTLTVSTEKDWSPLNQIFPKNTILDGELIGRKQGEVSNRLYLWDMPYVGGEDLTKVSYEERYQELRKLFLDFTAKPQIDPEWSWIEVGNINIGIAKSYPADNWRDLLERVKFEGSTGENEGIVFKDITHHLSWDRWKTREINEQVKFLLKYKKA